MRVSARTLLYASILLRMKSDILVNVPPPEDEYMDEPPDFGDIESDDFPILEPRLRHSASRPVTLQELIDELQRAVATKDVQALRQARKVEQPPAQDAGGSAGHRPRGGHRAAASWR